MEKRQRQGKDRKIMVGELVESMECVKKCRINEFPHPKKENAYQLTGIIIGENARPLITSSRQKCISLKRQLPGKQHDKIIYGEHLK
jgi:hypothetical protein